MFSGLELALFLLAAAVFGVVAFRLLHLPPMLGYLVAGIVIGPHALGFAEDSKVTHTLAEFGVVFLMFSVGLEFSLAKLLSMRRIVFGLGMAQVLLTIAATILLATLIGYLLPQRLGITWQAAFALGGALAMSSTAIVSKLLAERLELDSEHGRRIIAVLLFQDLMLVPLLIIVPALARNPDGLLGALEWATIKAILVLALLLALGQKPMRKWFQIVVKRRSQELFMLNLLLITLGAAWITERAGLSLALGAFVAGMLISETEYKYQVEEDIKPFRDVLLGLFFITIGMLLNIRLVLGKLVGSAAVAGRAAAAEIFPDRGPGQVVWRLGRSGIAQRPGAGAGRRIRFRPVKPGRRLAFDRSAGDSDHSGCHGVVDADCAVHPGQFRRHRAEAGEQRMDDAVVDADPNRQPHDGHPKARDHRRFRP